ncbi:hypothetical protein DFP72DRAFT_814993 [Ephemerocybe angulata]|uniref:Uncharacterized protein n=1 Tax=Ephemerocybe angulata TaxID=980116 RepID=A0A8H6HVR4_9AGAR|nr:hypothetical protein DFP72DRAFT_814993 [Tulosesus angulatus]
MRRSTAISILISGIAAILLPAVNAQPSARSICYTCPEQDNGLADLSSTADLGYNPFACVYGDAGTCHYSLDGDLAMDDNSNGCPSTALNLCLRRRAEQKERALPKSPRAPSPAAFATKPKVMQIRKSLKKERTKLAYNA